MEKKSGTGLDTSIMYLKGVGPAKSELLQKGLQISTFGELLRHYPFRYIDKTQITQVAQINEDSHFLQLRGRITAIDTKGDQRRKRLVARFADRTGFIELVWFKSVGYFQKYLELNKEYLVFGKPTFFNGRANIAHPEVEEVAGPISLSSRWMPVYSTTEKLKSKGLDSRGLAKLTKVLFEKIGKEDLPEILPPSIVEQENMMARYEACRNIHMPEEASAIKKAEFRLKFEEFFVFQVKMLQMKHIRKKLEGYTFQKVGDLFNAFFKQLPFELTGAQKRVLKEIRQDTRTGAQMNRLLQGDVGSGKTIVALMTMLMGLDNGFQACMMAPTEILAQQHYDTITKMLKGLDINVELLTGSVKGKRRRLLLEGLELGFIHILIGTHALIEDTVKYKELGMVVIDEQHRFGVEQRSKLWRKNDMPPHVLVMTATPIPRTLAMTLYGDLDVSVIDELPPGRKAIKTVHRYEKDRLRVLGFIKEEVDKGRQAYIVYPLIEESEHFNYSNLMEGYESISRAFPMPNYQVSIVHGQMHTSDKDLEMQRFKEGETHIMVATTVIEVGVDVPNASLMIIESANRFGLSQLHQLRGRVGRGAEQSFCILLTDYKLSNDARQRLQTMVDTNDGFKIAEMDMKLRGPGMIQGTQQSGNLNLQIADVIKDQPILQKARAAAIALMENDPDLLLPEHQELKTFIASQKEKERLEWSRIS